MFNYRIHFSRMTGILLIVLVCSILVSAQEQPGKEQISAMRKLNFLTGNWKGSGWIFLRNGQRSEFNEKENIKWKLDSLLLVIEGLGTNNNSNGGETRTVHNAYAIVYYNNQTGNYHWQSFISSGQSMLSNASLINDSTLVWQMDISPQMKIRYTIAVSGGKIWNEIGEMSNNGKDWNKFFGMNLTRADTK